MAMGAVRRTLRRVIPREIGLNALAHGTLPVDGLFYRWLYRKEIEAARQYASSNPPERQWLDEKERSPELDAYFREMGSATGLPPDDLRIYFFNGIGRKKVRELSRSNVTS